MILLEPDPTVPIVIVALTRGDDERGGIRQEPSNRSIALQSLLGSLPQYARHASHALRRRRSDRFWKALPAPCFRKANRCSRHAASKGTDHVPYEQRGDVQCVERDSLRRRRGTVPARAVMRRTGLSPWHVLFGDGLADTEKLHRVTDRYSH